MKPINKTLIVQFDNDHNKVIDLGGGITIIRPDEWLHKDGDDTTHTKTQENTNYLETKPQIATITHANDRYPYKVGDKVFLHYMAWVTAAYANDETKEAYIDGEYVFCVLKEDGTYQMAENIYFGDYVLTEDNKTPSGIIINVLGGRPKACQIKLTHVPEKHRYEIGETVLTIDNYQYPFVLDGKTHVMLRDREIMGRIVGVEETIDLCQEQRN